ncbi:polyprenyl synthetase family protein [Bacillus sp. PS06]|uniref:polyprenyl synthetase family protein n=1 Tax=Bacillus sp. PS06 TaxID=2764176 RepID=UPI00177BCCD6|nr:polyprenyl synthetase family protein [Bacillus sp. PS06]MBD8069556.1 polyprenyl synthetase family protein [Bacillus sp. PS06]
MNETLINADECYRLAEQRSAHYFNLLYSQVKEKAYAPSLTKDIQSWKQKHVRQPSIFSFFSRVKKNSSQKDYHNYIQWLNYTGKLDNYLDRSISYIYLRDLGKTLDTTDTQQKIERAVESWKTHLTNSNSAELPTFSMAGLYRIAQKEGVESTMIWVLDKLKTVSTYIPAGMDADQAQRKLIKIIAGVLMHEIDLMDDNITPQERVKKLDKAIRIGYSYGLTYPFIDDLLDANVLSSEEKQRYSNLIRTTLLTGNVPRLGVWIGNNSELITYIHSELKEAFIYIKAHQDSKVLHAFFEQSYVFFHSQEVDRTKDLTHSNYTNEELYLPVILKSAYSRLIARSVLGAPADEGFDDRTFLYGIYNQLADDFADMFDDMNDGAVTPYTYYLKYHKSRKDLINPFELYWTVISNLIHQVYNSDEKTCEIILNRAINGLKRYKERMGSKKYKEVMDLFATRDSKFNQLIQQMVQKADDVDFFDKLLRDHMLTNLRHERQEREDFREKVETIRQQINDSLPLSKLEDTPLLKDSIIEAANYSLKGDGKRLRPIMTWVMAVDEYRLNQSSIVPLLKSLEYMHTASLIFDDLPSQDNASFRRGRPTLHEMFNSATAELTGLFLTQKAIHEQTTLDEFDSTTVLRLIQYSARVTEDMCKGQAMDLESKGTPLTLEQLNRMCFYKTGLAFEASLIMPAILAKAEEQEIKSLKKFAYHAGIAFQVKDDILDAEGNQSLLGKPTEMDSVNNNSTFVTILGKENARKEMWDHYCLAMEVLQEFPRKTPFLKHLLNYIVNRDH